MFRAGVGGMDASDIPTVVLDDGGMCNVVPPYEAGILTCVYVGEGRAAPERACVEQ